MSWPKISTLIMEGFTNRNFPPTNWEWNYELLRESSSLAGSPAFSSWHFIFHPFSYFFSSWKWAVGITSGNSLLPGPYLCKALPGFFLCIFISLTCLKKLVFSKWDLSAVEGTSQVVLGSSDQRKVPASLSLFPKKSKNPSSALRGIRTWVQALPWFETCSFGLLTSGTDLKSRKGQYFSSPSPIHNNLDEGAQCNLMVHYTAQFPSPAWGEDLLCKRALGWWGLEAIGSVDHALVVVVEGLSVSFALDLGLHPRFAGGY
jgi:hypothetical protein